MPFLVLFSLFVLLAMTVFNWSKNRNIIFLTLALTFINLWAMLHYWLVIQFNEHMVAIFSNHFSPVYLLIGPSLYFYVRGVIKDDFIWKKSDYLHLIPALVQLVLILPYTFSYTHEEKVNLMLEMYNNPSDYLATYFNPVFNALQTGFIRIASVTLYLIYCSVYIMKYLLKTTGKVILNIQRHIVIRWLLYFHVSLFLILGLYIYLIYRSDLDHNYALTSQSHLLQNSLAFLISVNNLSLFLIPELMFGLISPKMPSNVVEDAAGNINIDPILPVTPIKEVEYLSEISKRIDTLMKLDQPYLKKDFRFADLANALDVPEHHLASCLRNIRETTFTDLKNSYRIEVFKNKIENGALKNLTIDALREECGFQSKSSFYSAFQKREGMTPMEYISKK